MESIREFTSVKIRGCLFMIVDGFMFGSKPLEIKYLSRKWGTVFFRVWDLFQFAQMIPDV